MNTPLRIYFDFISPYAYLAWSQVHALGSRLGRTVEARPVFFAAVLNTLGTIGPAEVPVRRMYVIKDVARAAHRANVPISPPPAHPFNPLPALRAVTAITDPAVQKQAIDALYRATWAGGGGIDGPQRVGAVLAAAGIDPAPLAAAAESAEVKERLKKNTDELLAIGGFGVPTLVLDDELFFGFDSFPHIEAFARGEDPVPADLIAKWKDLPSTASRPRR